MEQTFPTDAQTVKTLCARNPPWKLNRESRACARHNNSDREGRCSSFLEMFHESKEAGDRHPNVADLLLAQPDVSAGPCIWKHSQKQTQEAPVLAGTIHWAITKRPHPKPAPSPHLAGSLKHMQAHTHKNTHTDVQVHNEKVPSTPPRRTHFNTPATAVHVCSLPCTHSRIHHCIPDEKLIPAG